MEFQGYFRKSLGWYNFFSQVVKNIRHTYYEKINGSGIQLLNELFSWKTEKNDLVYAYFKCNSFINTQL